MDRALPSGDRNWAVAAHLTAALNVFSAPLPGLLGSVVTCMLTRERGQFARGQAREALNLQLNLSIVEAALVSPILFSMLAQRGRHREEHGLSTTSWALLGGAIAVAAGSVAFGITGARHAARGEEHRYPFIVRFVR